MWLRKTQPDYHADVSDDSELVVGEGTVLRGAITVTRGSRVVIGAGCRVSASLISADEGSTIAIEDGAVIESTTYSSPASVIVQQGGAAEFGHHCQFHAHAHVRFGGHLRFGARSVLNYASEIRCDEAVTIGEFCMMSYWVRIMDSDTHTVDWRRRRQLILADYPNGVRERERPNSRPVLIGSDVWLGEGVTVSKGAKIGDRTIVGMRCNVGGKDLPPDSRIVSAEPRSL